MYHSPNSNVLKCLICILCCSVVEVSCATNFNVSFEDLNWGGGVTHCYLARAHIRSYTLRESVLHYQICEVALILGVHTDIFLKLVNWKSARSHWNFFVFSYIFYVIFYMALIFLKSRTDFKNQTLTGLHIRWSCKCNNVYNLLSFQAVEAFSLGKINTDVPGCPVTPLNQLFTYIIAELIVPRLKNDSIIQLSQAMRKCVLCHISAFVVRCLDSIISLDSIAEISRL